VPRAHHRTTQLFLPILLLLHLRPRPRLISPVSACREAAPRLSVCILRSAPLAPPLQPVPCSLPPSVHLSLAPLSAPRSPSLSVPCNEYLATKCSVCVRGADREEQRDAEQKQAFQPLADTAKRLSARSERSTSRRRQHAGLVRETSVTRQSTCRLSRRLTCSKQAHQLLHTGPTNISSCNERPHGAERRRVLAGGAGNTNAGCGERERLPRLHPSTCLVPASGHKRAALGPSTPSLSCAFLSPHHHTQSASMKPITLYTVGTPSEHGGLASFGARCSRPHAPQTARRSASSSRS
jgi:hypothetical protein